jgi:hypothetical protein
MRMYVTGRSTWHRLDKVILKTAMWLIRKEARVLVLYSMEERHAINVAHSLQTCGFTVIGDAAGCTASPSYNTLSVRNLLQHDPLSKIAVIGGTTEPDDFEIQGQEAIKVLLCLPQKELQRAIDQEKLIQRESSYAFAIWTPDQANFREVAQSVIIHSLVRHV